MKEETWQPPADEIEREALALHATHWRARGYTNPSPPFNRDEREGWLSVATHVLIERHRRERDLVDFVARVSRAGAFEVNLPLSADARAILAAHAALDRESEPTQDSIVAELVAEWNLNSRAPGIAPLLDKLCALARERGK